MIEGSRSASPKTSRCAARVFFGCRRVRIAAQQAQLDLGGGTVKGITHGVAGGVEHAHQGGAGTVEILNDVSRVHPEVTLPQAAQSRR
ncbi:MAG: hypothetical protein DMG08_13945 [Acidobacteria bacterium]|nr:MAG: hypothetical protein DMG08_13945 [Acidobacteriota bacterium]